jgi:uncharacterized protein (DUF1778 family)
MRYPLLHVRATKAQIAEIKAAADHTGLTVSGWALERLLRAAREEASERS